MPAPHHPLPASEKARHDEIPEGLERDKGLGDDVGANRGERAGSGSGAVTGSGSGTGGGAPEDYDDDPQAGGGRLDQGTEAPKPGSGGDAPVGGSH